MFRARFGFGPHPAECLEPHPACLVDGTFNPLRRPAACGRRHCGARHWEPPSIQRAAAVDIRTDTVYGCDCSIQFGPGKLEELWPDGLVIDPEIELVAGNRYRLSAHSEDVSITADTALRLGRRSAPRRTFGSICTTTTTCRRWRDIGKIIQKIKPVRATSQLDHSPGKLRRGVSGPIVVALPPPPMGSICCAQSW